MCIHCVILYVGTYFVLYYALGVGVCIVLCTGCRYYALHIRCECMYCIMLYVMCGLYGCDVHYMCVCIVEEKALVVIDPVCVQKEQR